MPARVGGPDASPVMQHANDRSTSRRGRWVDDPTSVHPQPSRVESAGGAGGVFHVVDSPCASIRGNQAGSSAANLISCIATPSRYAATPLCGNANSRSCGRPDRPCQGRGRELSTMRRDRRSPVCCCSGAWGMGDGWYGGRIPGKPTRVQLVHARCGQCARLAT